MKWLSWTAGAAILLLLVPMWAFAIMPGDPLPLPEHEFIDSKGDTLTLSSISGERGTLIIFSSNQCNWVDSWHARITNISNRAMELGFGVVMLNPNDPEIDPGENITIMRHRAKEMGYNFPYGVDKDGVIARACGARRTPEVFLFDSNGHLAYSGAVDDNAEDPSAVDHHYLREAIDAMIKNEQIAIQATRAIGSSIHTKHHKG